MIEKRQFELGDVIAERRLEFESTAGWKKEFTIRVGRPVRDSRSERAWVCPLQIEGLASGEVVGIFGADAMQALLQGLHTIPGELAAFARTTPGQFTRFGRPDSSLIDPCRTVLEFAGAAFPREPDGAHT